MFPNYTYFSSFEAGNCIALAIPASNVRQIKKKNQQHKGEYFQQLQEATSDLTL